MKRAASVVLLIASALAAAEGAHQAPAIAKVALSDGGVLTVAFQGLGCSAGVCSRTMLRHQRAFEWLDTVAAIRDTSEAVANQPRSGMNALIEFKDGTTRRQAIVPGFRYLYYADQAGVAGKLDLAKVKSLEFLAASK